MAQLLPCPGCRRHVRADEGSCPFCDATLDLGSMPAPVLPADRRLSRAALLAFGATLAASLSTTACGGDSDTGGTGGADAAAGGSGGSTGGSGGSTGGSGGGSGGVAGENTGGVAGENTGGVAGNVAPPYGIPPDY